MTVNPTPPNHLPVKLRALLQRSFQRGEVDVDDAEAFGVAEGPFEVVEEGPDEVAADVRALLDGAVDGEDVVAEVVDAERVLSGSVDGGRWIVERGAVFGDVDRRGAVAVAEPGRTVGEALGEDFPPDFGVDRGFG